MKLTVYLFLINCFFPYAIKLSDIKKTTQRNAIDNQNAIHNQILEPKKLSDSLNILHNNSNNILQEAEKQLTNFLNILKNDSKFIDDNTDIFAIYIIMLFCLSMKEQYPKNKPYLFYTHLDFEDILKKRVFLLKKMI